MSTRNQSVSKVSWSDFPPSHAVIRVIVHMPFLPMDAVGQEDPPAEEVIDVLQKGLIQQGRGWAAPAPERQDIVEHLRGEAELQHYAPQLSSELRSYLPHRVAERWLEPSTHERYSAEKELQGSTATSWTHVATIAEIWSVGVGLLTSVYEVGASANLSWSEYGSSIYRACRLIEGLRRDFVFETARDLRMVIDTSPELRRVSRRRDLGQPAEVLWKHVLILCELPDGAGPDERQGVSRILVPDGERCGLPGKAQAVELCVGSSACAAYPAEDGAAAAAVSRVLGVLNVIWAASLDFDRILFRELRDARAGRHEGLDALETKAQELVTVYERVQEFRAAVDHTTVHLTRLDEAIWREVGKRWGQQSQLDALDKKLQALQHVYGHLATSLDTRRSRRLNEFVLVFTITAVLTLGLTVADFFGEYLVGLVWIKGAIIVGLLGLAVVVGLFIKRALRRESFRKRIHDSVR